MNKIRKTVLMFIITAFAMLASSCATLSKDECLTADWKLIGYKDGARGSSPLRIDAHRKSCAKHGVTPNLDQYNAGHAEGIRIFCVADNGYKRGLSGYANGNVCPDDLAPAFNDAHKYGNAIYTLRKEMERTNKAIIDFQNAIEEAKAREHQAETLLIEGRITRMERRELVREIRELRKSMRLNRKEAQALRRELMRLQGELEALEANNPYGR